MEGTSTRWSSSREKSFPESKAQEKEKVKSQAGHTAPSSRMFAHHPTPSTSRMYASSKNWEWEFPELVEGPMPAFAVGVEKVIQRRAFGFERHGDSVGMRRRDVRPRQLHTSEGPTVLAPNSDGGNHAYREERASHPQLNANPFP